MKDIYIQDFNKDSKIIDFINNQQQQATNWVKFQKKQIFSDYGVDYYRFIESQEKKYDITLNALGSFIQNELSKNFIHCIVNMSNNVEGVVTCNVLVIDSDLKGI